MSNLAPKTIKEVEKNEFIRVLNSKNEPMKKIWQKIGYCRFSKKYELQDAEDVNNFKYINKNKLVIITKY